MIQAPRILMFGRDGQLARALLAKAAPGQVTALARSDVDLVDPATVASAIAGADCDLVVNAAAWTHVDDAEHNIAAVEAINVGAPAAMALACAAKQMPFVHFSTDYVFPGTPGRAWREDDQTGPLNVYGRTKLEGESAVRAVWERSLIIRTSWIYSVWGRNFVATMLRLRDRPTLRVVDDQTGRPTDARELARFVLHAAPRLRGVPPSQLGVVHVAGGGPPVTWAAFARAVFEAAGGPGPKVEGITTAEYGAPAARPLNGVLDCSRAARIWDFEAEDWRTSLHSTVRQLQIESPPE